MMGKEDIDRMLAHAETIETRDALLDIRNGEKGPTTRPKKPRCQCPQRAHNLHRYGCKWSKEGS